MKKLGTFYTDNKDFVFIPNESLLKKICMSTKEDIVLYIKKFKNNYKMYIRHITTEDLAISGFIKFVDVPKEVIDFLNNELKNI